MRIGYALSFERLNVQPQWDARIYCEGARNILAGKGYSFDGERPTSFWPPLYPAFLAGVFGLLGDSYAAARIVQICLDVITVALVGLLASKIFNRRVGLAACAIAAVYPYFIHRSTVLMSEALAVPLLVALALVLYQMKIDFRRRHVVAAGILGALLMLCRSQFQLLVLLLPLWGLLSFRRWRPALARTLPAVAIMLLLAGPYLVRNAIIQGRFIGVSTQGGMTFYGAHNDVTLKEPEFDGFWINTERLGEVGHLPGGMTDAENSDRQFRLGLAAIRRNADRMPMHLLYKLRNFWFIHTHYFVTGGVKTVIPQLFYMLLLPFFFVGLFASFRGPLKPVFFYLIFVVMTLTVLVFYGNARMRAPIEPMIIILAAGGLVMAAGALWGEQKRKASRSDAVESGPADPYRMAYIMSQFPQTYETFILREIEGLAAKGIRPTIFSLKRCKDDVVHPAARKFLSGTVYSPFLFSAALVRANINYIFKRPRRYFGALWRVLKSCASHPWYLVKALAVFPQSAYYASIVEEEGIGHIHAHWSTIPADSAMIIARLAGITWSVTAHAFDIYTANPSLIRKLRSAKFVVTCTAYNVNYLSHLLPRKERAAVHLNYHGIDLSRYEFKPNEPGGTLRILAVGRLTETKGFRFLIDAVRILRERGRKLTCKIIGEGRLRGDLEEMVRNRGLEGCIELPGVVSHARVMREMRHSDCLVVPSVVARNGDRDGIPNVIPEAMALGLPVIASAVSGIPEFVRDGETGLLVKPGDSEALAGAVDRLVQCNGLRATMVENARALVEDEFDNETNVAALLQIFEPEVARLSVAKNRVRAR